MLGCIICTNKTLIFCIDLHENMYMQEVGFGPMVLVQVVLHDWVRNLDGKLSFVGFTKLLHKVTSGYSTKVTIMLCFLRHFSVPCVIHYTSATIEKNISTMCRVFVLKCHFIAIG